MATTPSNTLTLDSKLGSVTAAYAPTKTLEQKLLDRGFKVKPTKVKRGTK